MHTGDPAAEIFAVRFMHEVLGRSSVLQRELQSADATLSYICAIAQRAVADLRHADPARAEALEATLDGQLEEVRLRYTPSLVSH